MSQLEIDISASAMSQFPTPPPTVPQASQWSAAERKEFGTDRTATGEKIKRPMNAFMVWAQMRRAEITANSAKVHNSLISKALGVEWKNMSEEDKAPFVQKAKELRDELFREHPNYVYRPRKRKNNRHSEYPSPKDTPAPAAVTPVSSTPEQLSPQMINSKMEGMDLGNMMPSLFFHPGALAQLLPSMPQMNPLANPMVINQLNQLNQLLYSQMLAASMSKH